MKTMKNLLIILVIILIASSCGTTKKVQERPFLANHSTEVETSTMRESEDKFALFRKELRDGGWYVFESDGETRYMTPYKRTDVFLTKGLDSLVWVDIYELKVAYKDGKRITHADVINQVVGLTNSGREVLTEKDYKYTISEFTWEDSTIHYYGKIALYMEDILPFLFCEKESDNTARGISNETGMMTLYSDVFYVPTLIKDEAKKKWFHENVLYPKTSGPALNSQEGLAPVSEKEGSSDYTPKEERIGPPTEEQWKKKNPEKKEIVITPSQTSIDSTGATIHSVGKGETLGIIATYYKGVIEEYKDLSVWAKDGIVGRLKMLNPDMDPDVLVIGEEIIIKKP